MKQLGLFFTLTLLVLGSMTLEASAQGQDQIYPHRGSPTTGVIMETSTTEVTVDVRGTQRKIPVNEIKRIAFSDDTPELRRAREDILAGQLANGLGQLKKIDASSIRRDLVSADLQYYVAYCQGKLALSGGGDKAAATEAMFGFVRQFPQTYHFFEAAQLLGDLAAAQQDYDRAVYFYKAIGTKAPWPDYKMLAAVLEARALAAQEKFPEAKSKYEGVMAMSVDTPEATRQKLLAQVGQVVCMAETGQHEEGVKVLEEIIAKNDPQNGELFGRAYNALGRCHLKAQRAKDALLAYLHVDVLFYGTPEVHAEALYYLGKLWNDLNHSERAVNARNMLLERYSGSVWAKRS
ncbi:MAG: tol-pal system YbgF family protein [Pirellulaceae bacterium]